MLPGETAAAASGLPWLCLSSSVPLLVCGLPTAQALARFPSVLVGLQ